MQRHLVLICIAMSLVGHASAVELTHALTPQLADIRAARLFVHISSATSCDLSESKIVAAAAQTLQVDGVVFVDGLEPSRVVSPILEIDVDALELLRKCYLTLKILLRTGVTGGEAEIDDESEMVWGDVGNYVCVPNGFMDQVSELLQSRLGVMVADIKRARMKFPGL